MWHLNVTSAVFRETSSRFSLCCFVIYVYTFVLDKRAGFGCRHFMHNSSDIVLLQQKLSISLLWAKRFGSRGLGEPRGPGKTPCIDFEGTCLRLKTRQGFCRTWPAVWASCLRDFITKYDYSFLNNLKNSNGEMQRLQMNPPGEWGLISLININPYLAFSFFSFF